MWNAEFGRGKGEFGSGNAECGKKMKSEFGSQELKHRVELIDVRGKRTEKKYHGKTRKN